MEGKTDMTAKYQKVLIPHYMKDFHCIGPDCEDSCCRGWRVMIDEDSYKKYRKVKDPELRLLLDKRITRNRSNPSSLNYAKIKLDSEGCCPFISETGLCRIQLSLGEEALSITCTTYPRIYSSINGVLEKSATLSCPEAGRLALLNKELMEFDYIEEAIDRTSEKSIIDTHALAVANKPQRYFWELRIFTIDVLQNRAYTLSERLIFLGLFYQKLAEVVETGQIEGIPHLIADYTNLMESDACREVLTDSISANPAIQMELLKELADQRLLQGISNPRYMECYVQFLKGVAYTGDATVEEITERYLEAYRDYYLPFMQEREYILENYLVNYVFKNRYPFSGEKELFDNYVMMVIHYAMIKMHLIGMAAYHKDSFNEELVIKLIASFARVVEHNNAYLRRIHDLLKANGFTNMAYMAILIQN